MALAPQCQGGGGLGSGPIGAAPLGSGSTGGGLYDAVLVDDRTIDVYTVPLPGLAVPAYWAVAPVAAGDAQSVIAVTEQSPGTVWRLELYPGLTGGELLYTVTLDYVAAGVTVDPDCASLVVTSNPLVPVYPEPDTALPDPNAYFDIANPWLTRDGARGGALSTYQVTDDGDLQMDTRLESLRKRILRRLVTPSGGFALLPGYGLGQQIKGLVRRGLLAKLGADARLQVEQEPEVTRAVVVVQQLQDAPNVIVVSVRARTTLGLDVTANRTIDLRTGA